MDPNANLEEMINLASDIVNGIDEEGDKERMAELVLALDAWIMQGGFLPQRWSKAMAESMAKSILNKGDKS